jgi:hypothetical protein
MGVCCVAALRRSVVRYIIAESTLAVLLHKVPGHRNMLVWLFCWLVVFCNSLDGRRPANLQTALVPW